MRSHQCPYKSNVHEPLFGSCLLDTPLHSLGKKIRLQEEGGDKTRAWSPGSQLIGLFWETTPYPACPASNVKCTVRLGGKLHLKAVGGCVPSYPSEVAPWT